MESSRRRSPPRISTLAAISTSSTPQPPAAWLPEHVEPAERRERRRNAARSAVLVYPARRQRDTGFLQKYFALFTQNDWRASSKLTINLGLRWDLQPGPTERYNRMSSVDRTVTNAFGYLGAVVFPGSTATPQPLEHHVQQHWTARRRSLPTERQHGLCRTGFGVTYLPSKHRLLLGPDRLWLKHLLERTLELPYGRTRPAFRSSASGIPPIKYRGGRQSRGALHLWRSANPSSIVSTRTGARCSGISSSRRGSRKLVHVRRIQRVAQQQPDEPQRSD